jgi:transposase InsO family protein
MSWKQIRSLARRLQFVKLALKGQPSMSRLCRLFNISRRTGYKWRERFEAEGVQGLRERSRRPQRSPQELSSRWLVRVRQLHRQHRSWGSRKLTAALRRDYPRQTVPSARTIDYWLSRLNLKRRRSRRSRRGPELPRRVLSLAKRSNQVWTVDFKGWFRTGDGKRAEPLTVRDLFSRYLLTVRVFEDQRWEPIRRVFLRLFYKHGYPSVIRVDNGGPFGSAGPAGLSRLSAWWTALGIRVEFIAPGHPEQNAGHEQMHGVMKAEITRPASCHRQAQQRRSDRWAKIYNTVRPHEALDQRTPAQVYRSRPEGTRQPRLVYPSQWEVRRVRSNGQIKWRGRKRFVGEAFTGYPVGLKRTSQTLIWEVYFARLLIGELWKTDIGGMRPARCARRR